MGVGLVIYSVEELKLALTVKRMLEPQIIDDVTYIVRNYSEDEIEDAIERYSNV